MFITVKHVEYMYATTKSKWCVWKLARTENCPHCSSLTSWRVALPCRGVRFPLLRQARQKAGRSGRVLIPETTRGCKQHEVRSENMDQRSNKSTKKCIAALKSVYIISKNKININTQVLIPQTIPKQTSLRYRGKQQNKLRTGSMLTILW